MPKDFEYLLPDCLSPYEKFYLYYLSNNILYRLTSPYNQGIWENENERFEFYGAWFFKYWKNKNNSSPTYQGIGEIYRTNYGKEPIHFYFRGIVEHQTPIFCETTLDLKNTGTIVLNRYYKEDIAKRDFQNKNVSFKKISVL